MARKNPTSALRGGFDYQDLWGLKWCGEWLGNPSHYKWIQFETVPQEAGSNVFYLDDIVLLDNQGFYHLYQIKHNQNPNGRWTWNDLLTFKKSGTSLLQKWFKSIHYGDLKDKIRKAAFVTNGLATTEIEEFLENERFDIRKIKKKRPDIYTEIRSQLKDETAILGFFEKFIFRFGEQDFADLEEEIEDYFYRDLRATKSGVINLLHQIHKECRKKRTHPLDISTIRKWCEFDEPEPLNEKFQIPPDFEFFDKETHESILNDLQMSGGGIKVIFGKPGVGKSVYLSKLDEELQEKDLISIKHHYHIFPEDPNPQERLNAKRIIEAIKAQFKTHRENLGDIADKNSKNILLNEFISTLAKKFKNKGKAFVIIIDGLDHALGYGTKGELNLFLQQICFPQPGVWIVIGMQLIAKDHLPQIVFDKCPRDKWIEIKGLTKNAVFNLVSTNKTQLNLADQKNQLRDLVQKLYEITSGNPLHLRYSLKQLKNKLGKRRISQYECDRLTPYSGDIERYYQSLWNQLPGTAKTILLAISSVNFYFTYHQLIECVSSFIKKPTKITNTFNMISHLISRDRRNRVSIYHNSFKLFLRKQLETEPQKIVLKKNIKDWLEVSNYEYLKWAELKKIEYELGNSWPIFEIDRNWLIEAICYPRNPNQISSQMRLATKAAFDKDDFAKTLRIAHLHDYYLNSSVLVEETTELIWEEAIRRNDTVLENIDYYSLPISALVTLAEKANSKGDFKAVEEIVDVLRDRHDRQEYRKGTIPTITGALLTTIPYDRTREIRRIYKYIKKFSNLGITDLLFGNYIYCLLKLDQKEKVRKVLALDLTQEEKQRVLIECLKYDLGHKTEEFIDLIKKEKNLPAVCQLYLLLLEQGGYKLPRLPEYRLFPNAITEHDTVERRRWTAFYYDYFLIGLMYTLAEKEREISTWIKGCPEKWSAKAMCKLFIASLKIAKSIKNESRILYTDLFNPLTSLKELEWAEDRDSLNFQHSFSDAITLIFKDIILLKRHLNDSIKINLKDYHIITSKTFFTEKNLFDIILNVEEKLFTADAYRKFVNKNKKELEQTVNYFPERSEDYAKLSKLARIYGDSWNAKICLSKAADNLLGYGYRKDIYLFNVLEAVDLCAGTGSEKTKINRWLEETIPLIENVGDYTDGSETNHLPLELAGILVKYDQKLLFKDYYLKVANGELYDAEDLFRYVIRSLPFDNEEQITLATTALDRDSFLELKNIAQRNQGASKAVNSIQDYFGEIDYPKEEESSYSGIDKPEYDYSKVKPSGLQSYISKKSEARWDLDNYLIKWAQYWLERDSKQYIYEVLKSIVQKSGTHSVAGELLDIIYPLAYEFDNENAFEYLCWAQANDYGWARHWTDKKKAERRWRFVQEKYPSRYLEFFKKSISYELRDIKQPAHSMPLSRGVEFLTMFGDSKKAEEITDASIQFAEELMADLKLPKPGWIKQSAQEVDEIDILLQRLLWPSPLVRERAATGIAYLLVNSPGKKNVYEKILSWIQYQAMESTVAIGLLPLIRAFHLCNQPAELSYIKINSIVEAVNTNSVVIEKLVQELTELTGSREVKSPGYTDINLCPASYSTNDFFSKYLNTFLAPIYLERASKIEQVTMSPFVKQWAYTADEIVREDNISLNADQAYYYGSSKYDKFLLGFSSKISEVYRSAFLRVLQDFYKKGKIPEDSYLKYAYATLPIDLSKWKTKPTHSPKWWPQLAQPSQEEQNDQQKIVNVSFQKPIENLITNQPTKNVLIAAEGAIEPANSWRGNDPDCSFSLIGFAYKLIGSQVPEEKQVSGEILFRSTFITIPSEVHRPFSYLETHKDYFSADVELIRIKDLLVYPIVVRERCLCISLWQFFRNSDPSFHINVSLCGDIDLMVKKNGWVYRDSTGRDVITYIDWLEGLKERYEMKMPIPHGQYLEIDEDFINGWLNDKGLRLGYLLKVTYRHKQYSYDEVKQIEDFKLLNVSNIIIP